LKYCPVASRKGRNFQEAAATGWRFLITPSDMTRQRPTVAHVVRHHHYALDNGAWAAQGNLEAWDEAGFLRLLQTYGHGADFCVCPDVVGNADETFALSRRCVDSVKRKCGHVLFAVQDGMNAPDVEAFIAVHQVHGIFVGGTTEFKITTLPMWSRLAVERNLHLHVGRVNTVKRLQYIHQHCADSFDGSGVIKWSQHLALINAAVERLDKQILL